MAAHADLFCRGLHSSVHLVPGMRLAVFFCRLHFPSFQNMRSYSVFCRYLCSQMHKKEKRENKHQFGLLNWSSPTFLEAMA